MTSPQSWGQAHQGHGGADPGYGEERWEPARPRRNGMGTAALTLGLIGALLFWTILGGIALGLLALIFGIVGFRRGKRGEATNGTLAMVGAILGALALVGSSAILAFAVSVVGSGDYQEFQDCTEKAATTAEQQQCQKDFIDSFSK